MLGRGGGLRDAGVPSECVRKKRKMEAPASKCLRVFHISSPAKQAIAEKQQSARLVPEYVSNEEGEKENSRDG